MTSAPRPPARILPALTRRAALTGGLGAAAIALGGSPALAGGSRSRGGHVRWRAGHVFPSFPTAGHVRVADVRDLDGFDQLLLVTLQGLVNRDRPEIYLIVDDVDETWLPDLPVRIGAREKDALDLVGRYRSRIAGAVVYDIAVPHTVNLATTIAGLRGGVAATAQQAQDHGLPIIEDLRGRFAQDADAGVIHDWAMANLWDRCTHEILVGLPPTRSVEVEGVTWTELLREQQRVTDSSNRRTYEVDLTALLGREAVYLRLADAFPDDGWGPALRSVEVTVDGAVTASFTPGGAEEEPWLFDGAGSSTKEGMRFADGSGSFVYRFPVPQGAAAMSARLELENEFVVSATDVAPRRTEPFASFRDLAVATGALVSWLPPSGEDGSRFEDLLSRVETGTVYAGWFSNDVAGEWSGVELCSRAGVIVVAADYYVNASLVSAIPASTRSTLRRRRRSAPADRTYVTLTIGEGDNIQYCQRRMRELWDDPGRGGAPMNWTVSPLLEDVGPALLHHYQRTASRHDLLVCGPSGAGYTYGDSWPQSEFDVYTRLTGGYMARTGLDVIYGYSTPVSGGKPPVLPDRVLASYARNVSLRGIIQTDESGGISEPGAPVPLIGTFYPAGGVETYRDALRERIAQRTEGPQFIAGLINAWNWTPSDVVDLVGSLPADVEVVLADEFFDLFSRTA